jgi:5-methylcytosine-specific restriction protein A
VWDRFWDWWHGRPEAAFGRAPGWPALRKAHLRVEPCCQVCGTPDGPEVHHVLPVHRFPERELDAGNLLTLCRVHHLWVGHLGSWHSWNSEVWLDAAEWRAKIAARPK